MFYRSSFSEWDDDVIRPVEVEPNSLYDVSNIIQKNSNIRMDMRKRGLAFDIEDRFRTLILLTNIKASSDNFKQPKTHLPANHLVMKSSTFLKIIGQLGSLFDEIQLTLIKKINTIAFSGRSAGLSVETRGLEQEDILFQSDSVAEFPIKGFQHYSPLLVKFEKLRFSFVPARPLKVEGSNSKWRFELTVAKIDKQLRSSI